MGDGPAGATWPPRSDVRGHGRLVTDFGPAFDEAKSLAVQRNGRLVVAGRIREEEHARTISGSSGSNQMGVTILTFAAGGRALTDVAAGTDAARDLVIASNGKIVVAGRSNGRSDPPIRGDPLPLFVIARMV